MTLAWSSEFTLQHLNACCNTPFQIPVCCNMRDTNWCSQSCIKNECATRVVSPVSCMCLENKEAQGNVSERAGAIDLTRSETCHLYKILPWDSHSHRSPVKMGLFLAISQLPPLARRCTRLRLSHTVERRKGVSSWSSEFTC